MSRLSLITVSVTCLLVTLMMVVKSAEAQEYPTFESYNDAIEGLQDVVKSLVPLRDLLKNKTETQRLIDEQIRLINHLLRNNIEPQNRLRDIERELIQCNASLFVLEERRLLHEEQMQRLATEKKLEINNCELRLQLVQISAQNAAESLQLFKQLQQEKHNTQQLQCKNEDELKKLQRENEALLTSKLSMDQEMQHLKAENNKLQATVAGSDQIITRLSKMEQLATAEVVKLQTNIYELKEEHNKNSKLQIERHASSTIEINKENSQLKRNNAVLIHTIEKLNTELRMQQEANNEAIEVCNERVQKINFENTKLKEEQLKLNEENELIKQNNDKLNKENNELKEKIAILEGKANHQPNNIGFDIDIDHDMYY